MPDANATDSLAPRRWFDHAEPGSGWTDAIRHAESELLDRWRRALAEHDDVEVDRLVRASRSARFRASAQGDGDVVLGGRQLPEPWEPWAKRRPPR